MGRAADGDEDLRLAHGACRLRLPLPGVERHAGGIPGGRFHFNGAYTRASNSAAQNDRAQSWAQFLLGLPTATTGAVGTVGTASSQFEIAAAGEYSQMYHGLFIQDDWRVDRRLTINAGLRLEINGGMREAANRNLAGFDTTTPN